jgi:hypothetical protein
MPIRSAEFICRHVEALLAAKIGGQSAPRDTASWLSGISDQLRDKLVKTGVIDETKKTPLMTITALIVEYTAARTDVKPATLIHLDQAGKPLFLYLVPTAILRPSQKLMRKTSTAS